MQNSDRHYEVLAATCLLVAATICKHYHIPLLKFTIGLCKEYSIDPHLADDLMQDFYIKAILKPELFKKGYRKRGVNYFTRSIRNALTDYKRSLNIRKQTIHETPEMQLPKSDLYHFSQERLRGHYYSLIERVLDGKDIDVMKHYIDGYSYQEISELLAMPKNTVSSKINRAKKKLQHYYQKSGGVWDADFQNFRRNKPPNPGLFDNQNI